MAEHFAHLVKLVTDFLHGNQFFSGGALLAVLAALGMYGRRLGYFIADRSRYVAFSQLQLDSVNGQEVIWWVGAWMARDKRILKSKRVTAVSRGSDKPAAFWPMPGRHFSKYKGRRLIFDRSVEAERGVVREQWHIWLRGSRKMLEEFVDECRVAYDEDTEDQIPLYVGMGYAWESVMRRKRPLSTVILPGSRCEDLIGEMQKFWDSEDWYVKRGRPWRRGYLFEGPPGSGKTSFILAAASYFDKSVYLLNLGSVQDGAEATKLLMGVPDDCILVIEDIDRDLSMGGVVKPDGSWKAHRGRPQVAPGANTLRPPTPAQKARRRARAGLRFDDDMFGRSSTAAEDAEGKEPAEKPPVSLSILLSSLDGLMASDGRLLFITTNHPERIDPAIIRPGRIDHRVHFGYSRDQYRKMYLMFFPDDEADADKFADALDDTGISVAAVQEHLIRHDEKALENVDDLMVAQEHIAHREALEYEEEEDDEDAIPVEVLGDGEPVQG